MNNAFTVYVLKTFKIVVVIALSILFTRAFIIEPGRVNGRSMEHTFIDENIFLVNKFILLFKKPERGQVVQLIEPGSDKLIIKRIIGLPGEQVSIRQNKVFIINNRGKIELVEPYLDANMVTQSKDGSATTYSVIPPDEYFILGDNRLVSVDSRAFGTVHRSYIQGLVFKLSFNR